MIDAVEVLRIILRMVRGVDGSGRLRDARETGGRSDQWRNARRLDVVKVTTAILHHFVLDAEASAATRRIRVKQEPDGCRSRLEIVMICLSNGISN